MNRFLMAAFAAAAASSAFAQNTQVDYWQSLQEMPAAVQAQPAWVRPVKYAAWRLAQAPTLQDTLKRAPKESTPEGNAAPLEFPVPRPDGTFAWFAIVEAPVMQPELAAAFPEIRTYRGQGLDDPAATVRLDFTPQGFHASVLSPGGSYYVDPFCRGGVEYYSSYFVTDLRPSSPFVCHTSDAGNQTGLNDSGFDNGYGDRTSGTTLRTFRLAMAATGEFSTYHGGSQALAQAAIVTGVNRITQVWENECAIRMVLVANNQNIVYTNSTTDPYTGTDLNAMLGENQTNINSVIGSANYDIGHVVTGVNLGGLAQLGVVCGNSKARAGTGLSSPTGDYFWVSYVCHEMGHQFNATHSFNSNTSPCVENRSGTTAYEPGGGTTLMSYAGVCGADNIASQSNAYFHTASYDQIIAFATSRNCDVETATGNLVPTANAGVDRTIPMGTAFTVTGTASDANGDALTYCWEQKDIGVAQTLVEMMATDNGTSPIFRSFLGSTAPARTFPRYIDVLDGTLSAGERYPGAARTLDLRFTVRDNRSGGGGVNADSMVVNVRAESGPFNIVSPSNFGISYPAGSDQTITWNVANTTAAPVSATLVNILLSTDGGNTFPTVLAAATPNDGSETVTLPTLSSSTCRIRLEPTNNIFFDISNFNFTITCTPPSFPSSLQASDATFCDRVDLTWNPVAGAASYEILRNTVNLGSTAGTVGTSTSPSFSDTTAVAGTTYFYFVRSVDVCGSSGVSISNSGSRGSGAAVPLNVNASDGGSCGGVSVTWAASSGATGYQIWRATTDNSSLATQIGTSAIVAYVDNTAVAGTPYYYFIVATSSCGNSGFSASNSGFANTAPSAPTGLLASDSNCGNVQISWNSAAGATAYDVLRASVNNSASATVIGSPSTNSLSDTSAVAGTQYFYWVRATNACGQSSLAGSDPGLRASTPAVPTGLAATDSTLCDRVDLAWSAVVGATSYDVVRSATDDALAGSVIGNTPSVTYSDTAAPAGTTSFYFVKAINTCGESAFSASDTGTRAAVPAAPTAVAASDATQCDRVDLTWAASSGATSYEVFRAASDSSGAASSLGSTPGTSFSDTTAAPASTYFYFVRASSTCGASAFSTSDAGSAGGVGAAPTSALVDRNNFCENDTGSITLSATGTAGTTRWFSSACGGAEIGTGASLSIDSPTSTTTYFVRNDTTCGESPCASVTVTITPSAVAPDAITASRDNLCADDSGQVQLTAIGGSGTTLAWFSSACNGASIGTGNSIVIDSPTTTTSYFARWESACGESACASTSITVVPTPTVDSISISGASPHAIASTATVTVTLNVPAPLTGATVNVTSPAFASVNLPFAGGATSAQTVVTFLNYGTGFQAVATGATCSGGSASSSFFDVTAGPTLFVSTTGDDLNAGTSASLPVRNIQTALTRLTPGGLINIAPGTYAEHLTVDRAASLVGSAPATTTIGGGNSGRVVDITGSHAVSLSGLTVANGQSAGDGAGIRSVDGSSLTISNCVIANNSATNRGGGIDAQGSISIDSSTFTGNSATNGAALALGGGALADDGLASITNSTFSGNSASASGGAIYTLSTASMQITHATLTANSAANGGGLFISAGADAHVASSIIAANTATTAPDLSGAVNSQGFNLLTSAAGAVGLLGVDLVVADAQLEALADNGGFTPTHALLASSPAIDAADPACSLTTDQRATLRPQDGNGDSIAACDIGAYERTPGLCPWQLSGCPADYDNSQGVDGDDVIAFFSDWDASLPCADIDLSESPDGDDVILFFSLWDAGGC